MRLRSLRALLILALAAPGIGQNEAEPYFALASSRTFGTGGKPIVSLSAYGVKSLEFRVYRIQDPVKFFRQLEDAHQFGGRNPAPPREKTWLERIHDWKRGLRRDIRLSLRNQFTEAPSDHFEALLPGQSTKQTGKGTQFAEAPVLNSQQLVMTFQEPVRSNSRWETHNVTIPVKDRGVYLVEAVNKDLRAYTILMVSDIALMTKVGKGRIVAMAVDRKSGEPLPGVDVHMFTKDSKDSVARTDQNGLADMPIPTDRSDELRIVAVKSGDSAVTVLQSYTFSANRDQYIGYIYTDRPVYRPGHTVHLRGIVRLRTATGYQIPSGKPIQIIINDPDGKSFYQKTMNTSANGTIEDSFDVPAGAALGNYNINAHAGEEYLNGNFEVQEYKKPEYEVRVTPAKSRALEGETVQAVIEARYYFGEPVSNAKVKYSVYRSRYWFPMWYEPDEETDTEMEGPQEFDEDGEQLSDIEGKLDAEGKLTVNIPTQVSDHGFDYRYRVEAKVTDDANREISGTGGIVATYGSYVLNVDADKYFYTPGSTGTFKVEARDYDSRPVQAARVRLELARWDWRSKVQTVKASADVTTDAQGVASTSFTIPSDGGSYRVQAKSKTPEGREVQSYTYLWIAASHEMDIFGDGRKTITLVPDKKSYRPGDTAKVLVVTGKANTPVLLSIEGRDLKMQKVVRSQGSTVVFEIPITAEDEPGVWASAQFIRNGELYQGSKRLRVPPLEHTLNVKLSTDKAQYLPGQTASYTLDVSDNQGRPVPRAEFSLGVVDEAIYAIRHDTTPEIVNFFFGREWNSVYSGTSLEYFFGGEAGKRRMRLASLRPASQLAQLKPERIVRPKVRKLFPDTAFWSANLTTDASGKAVAKVAFPDSLTTWRATARGATPDTKVGAATLKTIVRKNLILRLAVPRFFIQGDEVTISAIVHNYLATEKTARVSLKLDGLDVLSGSTQDVKIASRGEVKLDWRVKARLVRGATVHGEALTDEESDALELSLPVNPPGIKLGTSKGGSLTNGATANFVLTYPPRVEPGSRTMSIRVAPSIAGSLFGALEYLTAFPYGCVEQTMSSFLPNIIVRKAVKDLGIKANIDEAQLNEKIRAGLDRLYMFQHEDGGWGWWQTDDTHPFMTAYVIAGLSQAKAAGVQVNEEAIQKGAKWLQAHNDSKWLADLRAYITYALAQAGQKADLPPLNKLSPYGLAIAGQVTSDKAQVVALLEKQVKQNDAEAWWPASRDEMLDFYSDVTPEATAYAVKFLAEQNPNHPLLPKAALWLMNHRNEGYWWSSTKQTAMVIYGLTDYLKATRELSPNLTFVVSVNDQQVLSKKLTSPTDAPVIELDESKLKPGENHIRVTVNGDGRLYYSARADYYSTEEKMQKTGTVSLNILRDYFKLVPTKNGERIVYDTQPLTGPVATGDVIAVRLVVTGSDWKYLLLEDPIPAGTEFIEKDNLYELKSRPPWWAFYFSRREMHDDRMAIFQTYFGAGQHQYFYLLKVVNPGQFKVSPARVQPMYQPEFLSTTESRSLEVR